MTLSTHLTNVVRRAKDSILRGEKQGPRTLVFVGREVHQFNYAFMSQDQGQDAALFMKAVAQILAPDFIASIATVSMATEGTAHQSPPQRMAGGEEGLFVMVTTPDAKSEVYLAKIKRDLMGQASGFEQVTGIDPQDLAGRISNPFLLPEEGLPDWLIDSAKNVFVQMKEQAPGAEQRTQLH